MSIINQLFVDYGEEYLDRFGSRMPSEHKKVIDALMRCRSPENGTIVFECDHCHKQHEMYCCCGNRHCPGCQQKKAHDWLEKQMEKQLPTHYFMVTFTVPAEIRDFFRSNQKIAYDALFKAASESIKKLSKDPRFIGVDLTGFFGVLHTWGRQLQYHPHIHFIIPGGGIKNEEWVESNEDFYLPVRALSTIVRAKFKDLMIEAGLYLSIDSTVWSKGWNVNCQPADDDVAMVKYLAPYVFKVAISNDRIIKIEDRMVYFTYKKQHSNRIRTMSLDVMEFMRRFLQHVLPTGFMKVRYFGFLSSSSKFSIDKIKLMIFSATGEAIRKIKKLTNKYENNGCDCGGKFQFICLIKYDWGKVMSAPSG